MNMKFNIQFGIKESLVLLFFLNSYLFKVYAQSSIDLISPNGGETWKFGTTEFISWDAASIESINLYYSTDGGLSWLSIATEINADSSYYLWSIPNTLSDSTLVKITDFQDPSIKDSSNAIFTIHFPIDKTSMKILPLGDSITFDNLNGDTRSAGERIAYRKKLWDILRTNEHSIDFIGDKLSGYNLFPDYENAGVPGITKTQLKELMLTGYNPRQGYQVTQGPYLNFYPADIYLLHIGTNELDSSGSVTDVEAILDEIKSKTPDAWVIVAQILLRIDSWTNENKTKLYNANLKNMINDRILNQQEKLLLVNMESGAGIDYDVDISPDSIHPNESGYNKMASAWYSKLNLLLPTPSKTIPVIEEIHDQTTEKDHSYKYFVKASGIEAPTFSLISNLPDMHIDSVSGVITWNPSIEGKYFVTVEATNMIGSSQESFFLEVVSELNYPEEVISYWQFDDNETSFTSKDLPGINDSYCSECPSVVTGMVNNALNFNNNELKVFDDLSLKFSNTESFSVEMWIKTNQDGSGEKKIIGKSLSTSRHIWWIGLDASNGNPIFFSADGNGVDGRCSANVSVNDGNWHHIVAVRENLNEQPPNVTGKMKLYVDGTLEQTINLFGIMGSFNSFEPLYIGYLNNEAHYNGIIDELAIYKSALNDSTIQSHFNKSLLGIGYFDDNVSSMLNESDATPNIFELYQNYPNPFNPSTNIEFSLPQKSKVKIDIFNVIGEHITNLFNKEIEAGRYFVAFNPINLPSGTYIYKIQANNFWQTKKMLLIK